MSTDRLESTVDGALQCPICKSVEFLPFNGRPYARCARCLSVERNRLLYMVLERLGLFRMGLRVLHFAPELAIATRYAKLCGDRYHACDVDPARYKSRFMTVRPFDLCTDLVKLPSRSFDVIIHSHVLEHLPCDVEVVLREMERILAPGGHHFMSVPIRGETTYENYTDDLMPAHRELMFGQEDHYRIFGHRSLSELLARVWGGDKDHMVQPLELFSEAELTAAGIPADAWSGYSHHSLFHHVRPVRSRVATPRPAAASPDGTAASPHPPRQRAAMSAVPGAEPGSRRRIVLHIGMPGAATRAIQKSLHSGRAPNLAAGLDYWNVAQNHSQAMYYAFASERRIAQGGMWFQKPGAKAPTIATSKDAFRAFADGLGGRLGFVSAESLWTLTRDEIRAFAAALDDWGIDASILCFVQSPAGIFQSAVERRCQSTLALSALANGPEREMPVGATRLANWLDVFGADRVTVHHDAPDSLNHLWEILAEQGVAPTPGPSPAANDAREAPALGLTAAKAMLALNERALTRGGAAPRLSSLLRAAMNSAGGEKFALPETVMARMGEVFARESDFLAERCGLVADDSGTEVACIDDHRFLNWSAEEVGDLLAAINDVLLAQQDAARSSDQPSP